MAHALSLHAHAQYVEQSALLARLRQSFADYREYLATCKDLNALSDRQLADFGVSRLNVREIARATVYGD